jgi:hypothetical protein
MMSSKPFADLKSIVDRYIQEVPKDRSLSDQLVHTLSPLDRVILVEGLEKVLREDVLYSEYLRYLLKSPCYTLGLVESERIPAELVETAKSQGLNTLSSQHLIRLATFPHAMAAVVDQFMDHHGEESDDDFSYLKVRNHLQGIPSSTLPVVHGASIPSTATDKPGLEHPRKRPATRYLYWIVPVALAASVVFFFNQGLLSGEPAPRVVGGQSRTAGGLLGATTSEDGVTISWQIPEEVSGYITVIERGPTGPPAVRPSLNRLCQHVLPGPRPVTGIESDLLFSSDQRGDVVVWLLLTKSPAAQLLTELVSELRQDSFQGDKLPEQLTRELSKRGAKLLVISKVLIHPK